MTALFYCFSEKGVYNSNDARSVSVTADGKLVTDKELSATKTKRSEALRTPDARQQRLRIPWLLSQTLDE